jgi:hypothetical protein
MFKDQDLFSIFAQTNAKSLNLSTKEIPRSLSGLKDMKGK